MWPVGLQVQSASGYWRLTQRNGAKNRAGSPSWIFRVFRKRKQESGQAPAKGSQVKVLILFLSLASCPMASSSPESYSFALIFSYFLCREQEEYLLHLFYPPVLVTMYYSTVFYTYSQPTVGSAGLLDKAMNTLYTTVTSTLNPLIYTLRKKEFKMTLKKILFSPSKTLRFERNSESSRKKASCKHLLIIEHVG